MERHVLRLGQLKHHILKLSGERKLAVVVGETGERESRPIASPCQPWKCNNTRGNAVLPTCFAPTYRCPTPARSVVFSKPKRRTVASAGTEPAERHQHSLGPGQWMRQMGRDGIRAVHRWRRRGHRQVGHAGQVCETAAGALRARAAAPGHAGLSRGHPAARPRISRPRPRTSPPFP